MKQGLVKWRGGIFVFCLYCDVLNSLNSFWRLKSKEFLFPVSLKLMPRLNERCSGHIPNRHQIWIPLILVQSLCACKLMEEVNMFRVCAWTVMWLSEKNINGDISSFSIIFHVLHLWLFLYFSSSLKIHISYWIPLFFPLFKAALKMPCYKILLRLVW